MSDETYKKSEAEAGDVDGEGEGEDSPPYQNLGVPESQPQDLGVHKVVYCDRDQADTLKASDIPSLAITIVQDEKCQWEKGGKRKNREMRNRIITASVICLVFIAMEFVGGYFSNSLVIAADAAQLLTVFSSLMVSLFSLKLADGPGEVGPLGWRRADVMTGLLSVLLTWVLTSIVLYLAFDRLVKGNFFIDVDMMLATSAFGVVANLVMGMALHNNCHVRYPASCDGDSPRVNSNVRAAFVHIVCDFLFSLGVFITALFIDCCPDWFIVDPICTLVFGVFVLFITLAILRDILNMLAQEMPKGVFLSEVIKGLLDIEGVQQVHDLRFWALSLDKIAMSAHITISPGVDHNGILQIASRRLHSKYNLHELTVHMEVLQPPDPLNKPHTIKQ